MLQPIGPTCNSISASTSLPSVSSMLEQKMEVDGCEMPGFARKRMASGAAEGEAESSRATRTRRVDEAKTAAKQQGKSGEKDVLEQLVMILAQLCLANSSEIRELTGMLVVTHLLPVDSSVAVACLAAGKEYQNSVATLRAEKDSVKKQREEGKELEDPEELGAPHVVIAMEGLMAIMKDEKIDAKLRKDLGSWWKDKINGKTESEIKEVVQMWRLRKPQKGKPLRLGGKGSAAIEYVKLTFSFSEVKEEELLCKMMKELGGQRKIGAAPKGWLEREASKLLAKAQKSSSSSSK